MALTPVPFLQSAYGATLPEVKVMSAHCNLSAARSTFAG